jgi:hypothetical protein
MTNQKSKASDSIVWILIVLAQLVAGYGLAALLGLARGEAGVETTAQFLSIPLQIWLGYSVGVSAVGVLGMALKKETPLMPGLRFMTTATLALVPMLVLVFNALTIGVENQEPF